MTKRAIKTILDDLSASMKNFKELKQINEDNSGLVPIKDLDLSKPTNKIEFRLDKLYDEVERREKVFLKENENIIKYYLGLIENEIDENKKEELKNIIRLKVIALSKEKFFLNQKKDLIKLNIELKSKIQDVIDQDQFLKNLMTINELEANMTLPAEENDDEKFR